MERKTQTGLYNDQCRNVAHSNTRVKINLSLVLPKGTAVGSDLFRENVCSPGAVDQLTMFNRNDV